MPTSSDVNSVAGTVIGVAHLGETMQYLVRIGEDQSIISRRPTPEAPDLVTGSAVVCSWSAEHVLLFPGDQDAAGYVPPPTD